MGQQLILVEQVGVHADILEKVGESACLRAAKLLYAAAKTTPTLLNFTMSLWHQHLP